MFSPLQNLFLFHATHFENAKKVVRENEFLTENEILFKNLLGEGGLHPKKEKFKFDYQDQFPGIYFSDSYTKFYDEQVVFVMSPGLLFREDYHINNRDVFGEINPGLDANFKTYFPENLNEFAKDYRKNLIENKFMKFENYMYFEIIFQSRVPLDTLLFVIIKNPKHRDFFSENGITSYFDMPNVVPDFLIPKYLGFNNPIRFSPIHYSYRDEEDLKFLNEKYKNILKKEVKTFKQFDKEIRKAFKNKYKKVFSRHYAHMIDIKLYEKYL